MIKYFIATIFILLTLIYYYVPLGDINSSQIILTVSTFLFSIFTGFFIARQGTRYSAIRDQITNFDGEMSSIYRHFGHLKNEAQVKVKKLFENHYTLILKNKSWDYHFINKSNTLTELHKIAETSAGNENLNSLRHLALQRILAGLEAAQIARKKLVALRQEQVPSLHWILIYLLALILFLTLSIIYSQSSLLASVLKAGFATSIIAVLILLNRFDQLKFFEKTIGEKSALDVLDILVGKK